MVVVDVVRLASLAARSHSALAAENFSETIGAVPRAEDQITTRRRFHPLDDGHPAPNVPVARGAGECEGGHTTPLAPQRIPTLLALEVQAHGKTSFAQKPSGLIRKMAAENPTWGEERIANELKMKLGIRVLPRTGGKYLSSGGPRREPDPKQRWLTFVRNHAKVIVACDFFEVVTASFRTVYVFVIMELGTANASSERDRPPDGRVDPAAIPEGPARRSSLSIPDPRSGQHLLERSGQGSGRHGCTRVASTLRAWRVTS